MDKLVQFHVWYVIAAIIGVVLLQQLWEQSHQVAVIPYSEYLEQLKAENVQEVRVSGDYIEGQFKKPRENGGQKYYSPTQHDHERTQRVITCTLVQIVDSESYQNRH